VSALLASLGTIGAGIFGIRLMVYGLPGKRARRGQDHTIRLGTFERLLAILGLFLGRRARR